MSLVKTLAKVAIGVAIAKGVQSMARKGGDRGQVSDDGLFRGAQSPSAKPDNHGLEDMMDNILGGRAQRDAAPDRGPGGLGGLLEDLAQPDGGAESPRRGGAGSGGLDDLLGGLAQGGGLGGLLGGLAGQLQKGGGGSFAEVLNSQFDSTPEPARDPSPDQEAAAGLMLAAMIQAAKADGRFDRAEHGKLMDKLGEVSPEERAFVRDELDKPVDLDGLVRAVPRGLEAQVYTMSVLGIDLDSQAEAQYLHGLAQGMGLSQDHVNHIHDRLGVPRIYR